MKNRNLWLTLGAIILIVLVVLIGIRVFKKPASEENVIKIGAILPLTGEIAYLGEEEKNALSLFENDVYNNSLKIKFLFEDSKGNVSDGISAFNKLLSEGVKAYIVSLTRVTEGIQPIAEKHKVLIFTLSLHPYIASRSPYTFRIYLGLEDVVKQWIKWIEYKKAKKVAALYVRDASLDEAIKILRDKLKDKNIEFIASETYEFNERNIRSKLLKIVKYEPDIIVTEDFGNIYPILFKEAKQIGVQDKILAGLGLLYIQSIDDPKLIENIPFVGPSFTIINTIEYKNFRDKYFEKFKRYPSFDGVYTYMSAQVLWKAISQLGELDVEKIKELLIKIGKLNIFGEEIVILADGTGKCPLALGMYKDGKIQPILIGENGKNE